MFIYCFYFYLQSAQLRCLENYCPLCLATPIILATIEARHARGTYIRVVACSNEVAADTYMAEPIWMDRPND